eukprot:scaffold8780_cov75-Phaeocystis_antarctica.AAC.1
MHMHMHMRRTALVVETQLGAGGHILRGEQHQAVGLLALRRPVLQPAVGPARVVGVRAGPLRAGGARRVLVASVDAQVGAVGHLAAGRWGDMGRYTGGARDMHGGCTGGAREVRG